MHSNGCSQNNESQDTVHLHAVQQYTVKQVCTQVPWKKVGGW